MHGARLPAAVVTTLLIHLSADAQQAWVPVWADEFNGTALDLANWQYQVGTGTQYGLPAGWGNNELQFYTNRPQNIGVANGLLTITARQESYNGASYTSARIRSLDRRQFTYGRYEARLKVPAGQGLWPAFWMLPSTNAYGGWASSGEIDILETVNAATAAHGTIHHGGNWPNNVHTGGSSPGTWSNDFHVYAVEWEPDEIRWYVDGSQFFQTTSSVWFSSSAPTNDRAPFDRDFHFLLNLAVGGNWPGPPNGSTPFPSTFQIDYVRVQQRPPKGPYTGVAPRVPARIEAEHFDLGGGSIAYRDLDGVNQGGQLRLQEAVDIQACTEGGFNIGWFRPTEWMEYTIDVPRAGRYEIRLRTATTASGVLGRVHSGGVDSGSFALPTTGGWQTFRTTRVLLDLPAGVQSLRLSNTSPSGRDFNVNWLDVLVAGDVDGNARAGIDDLYAFDAGIGPHMDIDADGVPGTSFDRRALIDLLRVMEWSQLLQGR